MIYHHFFLGGMIQQWYDMIVGTPSQNNSLVSTNLNSGRQRRGRERGGTEGHDCLGRNFYKCRRVLGWTNWTFFSGQRRLLLLYPTFHTSDCLRNTLRLKFTFLVDISRDSHVTTMQNIVIILANVHNNIFSIFIRESLLIIHITFKYSSIQT